MCIRDRCLVILGCLSLCREATGRPPERSLEHGSRPAHEEALFLRWHSMTAPAEHSENKGGCAPLLSRARLCITLAPRREHPLISVRPQAPLREHRSLATTRLRLGSTPQHSPLCANATPCNPARRLTALDADGKKPPSDDGPRPRARRTLAPSPSIKPPSRSRLRQEPIARRVPQHTLPDHMLLRRNWGAKAR
ncbi:hypothetical protein C8Q80DRAFT_350196 [Daedaleopsis nitida]|nr:hypothetical protein C8Q80DRAFT_350196 [Daedaleopsis nitida]